MKLKFVAFLVVLTLVITVVLVFIFKDDFLFSSVRESRQPCTKFFLAIGADPVKKDVVGNSLIHLAVYSKSSEMVKMLIDKKVDLNVKDMKGGTPLDWAISFGTLDIVKLLVENGAHNFRNSFGETSVLSAALSNKTEIFKYLFKKFGVEDTDKEKLLNKAIYNSNVEILEFLDKNGFDLSSSMLSLMVRKKNDEKKVIAAMDFLLKKGADINIADKNGKTALIEAASREKNEILKFLVEKSADIKLKDKTGKTAADWAGERKNVSGVKILKKAADMNDNDNKSEEGKPSE